RKVRLRLEVSDRTNITLYSGMRSLYLRQIGSPAAGGVRLIEFEAPPGPTTLRIVARDGWEIRLASLRLSERNDRPWIREANTAWIRSDGPEAERLLRAHQGDLLEPDQRARATSLLAKVIDEMDKFQEEENLFKQAISLDGEAGLSSSAAG